jgi:hypothetical protein
VIEENCVGEVELEGGTVWFLHVRRVCGPLLYASYLGTGTLFKGFFYINYTKFCRSKKYYSRPIEILLIVSALNKKVPTVFNLI